MFGGRGTINVPIVITILLTAWSKFEHCSIDLFIVQTKVTKVFISIVMLRKTASVKQSSRVECMSTLTDSAELAQWSISPPGFEDEEHLSMDQKTVVFNSSGTLAAHSLHCYPSKTVPHRVRCR